MVGIMCWCTIFTCYSLVVLGIRCCSPYLRVTLLADIEELTRRTGNFKQFNVFVNMLELGCTKVKILIGKLMDTFNRTRSISGQFM